GASGIIQSILFGTAAEGFSQVPFNAGNGITQLDPNTTFSLPNSGSSGIFGFLSDMLSGLFGGSGGGGSTATIGNFLSGLLGGSSGGGGGGGSSGLLGGALNIGSSLF